MGAMSDLFEDPGYRALVAMVRERLPNEQEREAIENRSTRALSEMLLGFMRLEYIVIPPGTAPIPCRWCAQPVYWVRCRDPKATVNGRRLREPVSIGGPDCNAPTHELEGCGFLHLVDCPRSVLRAELRPTTTQTAKCVLDVHFCAAV
jgi:hypothetical protein